jgi:GT2 family glycosyltransferase
MTLRYLFGPVTAAFADQYISEPRGRGECLTFHPTEPVDINVAPTDSWDEVLAKLPANWRPDLVVLYLPYTAIPFDFWRAPVPSVALAYDWDLLWHLYCRHLPYCDAVLADPVGVQEFNRQGFSHLIGANLFGLGHDFAQSNQAKSAREIDILFIGTIRPAGQPELSPWIARIARLGYRWRVVIHQESSSVEVRDLMNRARIIFNRSRCGVANRQAFEALAAGALLFQEPENREISTLLRDREECVFYDAENLESLLEHYLEHEEERARIAAAGQRRAGEFSFEHLWQTQLAALERDWPVLVERAKARQAKQCSIAESLDRRLWEVVSGGKSGAGLLERDLADQLALQPREARWHYALGLLESLRGDLGKVAGCFRRAVSYDPGHVVAGTALASALAADGKKEEASAAARLTLNRLDGGGYSGSSGWDQPPFPAGLGGPRVGWEHAGWKFAGQPSQETKAKADLLKATLHQILAESTDNINCAYEAALLQPHLAGFRRTLGNLLRKAGQPVTAIPHLQRAQEANPFDRETTRALFVALGEAGDGLGQRRLAAENRDLQEAAPKLLPMEGWIANVPPPPSELVTIIVLCCNEVACTRMCLESVLHHTRPPYELVLVDNGSADETPAYLHEVEKRCEPERVMILRNETNVGFPAGCNQALAKARGRQVVFLNNDTIVVARWLESLVAASLLDWPKVGLVGAVSNYVPPPQLVKPGYGALSELDDFAARHRAEFAGQTLSVERLSGFCLLARRAVLKQIGKFDEQFGLGFFDDDDLGIRVRQAGFELRVALDCYIHHFGSRTFRGLGIDCEGQLRDNFVAFKAKWGEELTAGYRMPQNERANANGGTISESHVEGQNISSIERGVNRVSLCMIVKNEEHNLPACLESVAGLVDEMVIVDTGSTDATRAIAESHGARVFDFPWVDNFAAARNESLRYAKGEWIFWMDADDRLEETSRPHLQKLFADLRPGKMAFSMKCLCVPDPSHPSPTVVDHIRLFPNQPNIRWHYRVHEQILPSIRRDGGSVCFTPVVIRHVGYQDPALRRRKLERDLRLLELDHQDEPGEPFTLFNLGCVYQELGKSAEALAYLRESLKRSQATDSIVRKLYALIAACHRQLGQHEERWQRARQGGCIIPTMPRFSFTKGWCGASWVTQQGAKVHFSGCFRGKIRFILPASTRVCAARRPGTTWRCSISNKAGSPKRKRNGVPPWFWSPITVQPYWDWVNSSWRKGAGRRPKRQSSDSSDRTVRQGMLRCSGFD